MARNYKYILTIRTFATVDGKIESNIPIKEDVVITNPLTMKFSVSRDPLRGQNIGVFDVYNLNRDHREEIFYDYRRIQYIRAIYLEAGYENDTEDNDRCAFDLIYSGMATTITSKKVGQDVITHIEAMSGLMIADSSFSLSVESGVTDAEISVAILQDNLDVSAGTQSFKQYRFIRPVALYGNAVRLLKIYSNGRTFIDLNRANTLNFNDEIVSKGYVLKITDSTGLLGTPVRTETLLDIDMMFEPRLQVGHGVEIESFVETAFNGQYMVWSVSHSGVFGYGDKGDVKTHCSLFVGIQTLGRFRYGE